MIDPEEARQEMEENYKASKEVEKQGGIMEHSWHKSLEKFNRRTARVRMTADYVRSLLEIPSILELRPIAERIDKWMKENGALKPTAFLRWIKYEPMSWYIEIGWQGPQFNECPEGEETPEYMLKHDAKTDRWNLIPESR